MALNVHWLICFSLDTEDLQTFTCTRPVPEVSGSEVMPFIGQSIEPDKQLFFTANICLTCSFCHKYLNETIRFFPISLHRDVLKCYGKNNIIKKHCSQAAVWKQCSSISLSVPAPNDRGYKHVLRLILSQTLPAVLYWQRLSDSEQESPRKAFQGSKSKLWWKKLQNMRGKISQPQLNWKPTWFDICSLMREHANTRPLLRNLTWHPFESEIGDRSIYFQFPFLCQGRQRNGHCSPLSALPSAQMRMNFTHKMLATEYDISWFYLDSKWP